MSIKSRIQKVRAASQNVVLTLCKSPRVAYYGQRSVSNLAVNYQQRIEWLKQLERFEDISYAVVSCTCHQATGVGMLQPACRGNEDGTICYHSLAALTKRAEDAGQVLSLFDNFSDAARYANFGGKLIKVISSQGSGYCWGVSMSKERMD